ncbi:MAG TPA: NnrS family protein [Moraxellaceae bacterium]|nr:NnrS family protein [Moraxellaceae bacterium]
MMKITENTRTLFPLWRLGFRPFFLGGAGFATLAILLWLAFLGGVLHWHPAGGMLAWHRHEMMFGFAAAIVAGFLLTAVQNWTATPGLTGRPLAVLAGIWLAGRLAWLLGAPLWLLVPVDVAFLPLAAIVVGRQIFSVKQIRNYPVPILLLLMTAANSVTLAGLVQGDDELQRQGVHAGLWLVAAMMGLIGGRVIPFFTQRGLMRKTQAPAIPALDRVAMGSAVLAAVLTAAGLSLTPSPWMAIVFAVMGISTLIRMARWQDRGIWGVPLLWSLHLAFLWLALAPLGMALWHLGIIDSLSLPLHALTIGAMGGLILAMIARVTLGHTGRPLQPPAAMSVAFIALNASALSRVMMSTGASSWLLWLSGALWILAFGLYLFYYARMLVEPRIDGMSG